MNNREVDNKAEKNTLKLKTIITYRARYFYTHLVLEDPGSDSIAALEDRRYSFEVAY